MFAGCSISNSKFTIHQLIIEYGHISDVKDQVAIIFKGDGVGFGAGFFRYEAFSCFDFKFPAVPTTADKLTVHAVVEFKGFGGEGGSGDGAFAQRAGHVGTAVVHGVVVAVNVEESNRFAVNVYDGAVAIGKKRHSIAEIELFAFFHCLRIVILCAKKKRDNLLRDCPKMILETVGLAVHHSAESANETAG